MRSRRLLSVMLVLLCGVILWGCSGNKNRENIQPLKQYYLTSLFPYSFFHKIEKTDDSSFLEFDADFQFMWISFDTLAGHVRVDFVITSCQRKNAQIKGTASRIEPDGSDKGKLITYSFWSDSTTIYLQTLVTYRVGTGTDVHEVVTVPPYKMVEAKFARTAPSYITGGGA